MYSEILIAIALMGKSGSIPVKRLTQDQRKCLLNNLLAEVVKRDNNDMIRLTVKGLKICNALYGVIAVAIEQ